jgi:nucleoside 2-deoxyribosyltransferase
MQAIADWVRAVFFMFCAVVISLIVNSEGSMAQAQKRIYLTGPLGFSEAGNEFKDTLVKKLKDFGYEVIDPFILTPKNKIDEIERIDSLDARSAAWRTLNPQIAQTNQNAIDGCDGVLAILDGPDVDSGTAAEIGYAFARQKPDSRLPWRLSVIGG